jgi:hypothetical protein
MKDKVEDPGGDLRAVEGTDAEVAVETDRPLMNGALLFDDGTKVLLRSGENGLRIASVPIRKDGMYHIAAVDQGEDVRLSPDYFIEAQKDEPPTVRITRPERDARVNPDRRSDRGGGRPGRFRPQRVEPALLRERRCGEDRLAAERAKD